MKTSITMSAHHMGILTQTPLPSNSIWKRSLSHVWRPCQAPISQKSTSPNSLQWMWKKFPSETELNNHKEKYHMEISPESQSCIVYFIRGSNPVLVKLWAFLFLNPSLNMHSFCHKLLIPKFKKSMPPD